jgi:adenylyl-sulfate kinase
VWITGLSASGKTTTAAALERRLLDDKCHAYALDGDNIRQGLCSDLGYSREDRKENIRRVSEVAALFADAGMVVIGAFISPFKDDRARARSTVGTDRFLEIYLATPLEICEQRDRKHLYEKARAGAIRDFTGISSPYEAPEEPEVFLDTSSMSVSECVEVIVRLLQERGFLSSQEVGSIEWPFRSDGAPCGRI